MGTAGPAAVTAGAGLVGGGKNNKSQQSQANKANAAAQGQIQRQNLLFDTIMNLAKNNQGALSADGQISNLAKDQSFWNSQQLGGTAAALRTAGYQPGDSEIGQQLSAVNQRNQRSFLQQANQIRVNAPLQQEALYGAANPGSLNAGLGYDQNQENAAYSRMSSPSSLIGAATPFLNPNLYKRQGFNLQGANGNSAQTDQYGNPL